VIRFSRLLLGVAFLVQLQGTQAQGQPLRASRTSPCSVNLNTYTQADVISAQAELELRRNILKRMQTLANAGVVPRSWLDDAVYQERVARINLELAQTASSPRARVTEAEIKAQLSQAQAELELRRLEVQRLERLADVGAVARSHFLEAIRDEQKARANLQRAQACLRDLGQ
jgi:multidrug resistance efflux pump